MVRSSRVLVRSGGVRVALIIPGLSVFGTIPATRAASNIARLLRSDAAAVDEIKLRIDRTERLSAFPSPKERKSRKKFR
jgi:hypothetical protein